MELKRASAFKAEKILAPSGDQKNYRLVIDLFNKKVEKAQQAPAAKAIAPAVPALEPPSPAPAAPAAPAPKAPEEDFP